MASAATRGAVGDFLHGFEEREDVLELLMTFKSGCDVVKANLHTVANGIIFFHKYYLLKIFVSGTPELFILYSITVFFQKVNGLFRNFS